MNNTIKAIFMLTILFGAAIIAVITDNSGWLLMWFFLILTTVLENDKDNWTDFD